MVEKQIAAKLMTDNSKMEIVLVHGGTRDIKLCQEYIHLSLGEEQYHVEHGCPEISAPRLM